jgi:hypothetical protein
MGFSCAVQCACTTALHMCRYGEETFRAIARLTRPIRLI